MALSIRTTTRNNRISEINTDIGGGGKIKFYTGSAPTSVNDAATGTLLAECICNASAFGTVSAGVLTAQNVSGQTYVARDSSSNATGTVGYCRITDSSDNEIIQLSTVGTTGSGAEVILPSLSVTATEPFEVQTCSLTEGNP